MAVTAADASQPGAPWRFERTRDAPGCSGHGDPPSRPPEGSECGPWQEDPPLHEDGGLSAAALLSPLPTQGTPAKTGAGLGKKFPQPQFSVLLKGGQVFPQVATRGRSLLTPSPKKWAGPDPNSCDAAWIWAPPPFKGVF